MAKKLTLGPVYEMVDFNDALGNYDHDVDGVYAVAKGDGGEKLYEIPQKTNGKIETVYAGKIVLDY